MTIAMKSSAQKSKTTKSKPNFVLSYDFGSGGRATREFKNPNLKSVREAIVQEAKTIHAVYGDGTDSMMSKKKYGILTVQYTLHGQTVSSRRIFADHQQLLSHLQTELNSIDIMANI